MIIKQLDKSKLILLSLYTLVLAAVLYLGFKSALLELYVRVSKEERYSHGLIIPFVVIYLIYQKRYLLQQQTFRSSWIGFFIVSLAIVVFIVGSLSALWTMVQYALFFMIIGVLLSYMGWQTLKIIIIPLLLLLLSIPLPFYIDVILSGKFQLISSQLGVQLVRLFNIPVYLEGNVIDLGNYKLQVIEACSGLNYLYPLMSIGIILAYMYKDKAWKKLIVFLSTIPITILMNSFRIGVIALLVDNYGISMAEGALHDFEGWMVYMVCIGILLIEIKLLSKQKISDVLLFSDAMPDQTISIENSSNPEDSLFKKTPFIAANLLILIAVFFATNLAEKQEVIPDRLSFSQFPETLDDNWLGKRDYFKNNEQKKLMLTDYVLMDYFKKNGTAVNLYIGFHGSQRNGTAPHSPRACLPGNGWEIASLESYPLEDTDNSQFFANRLIIQKGETKQLVYYWFQQRGRKMDNEFIMKWYLFKDAMLLNRSDGSLVRLTTPVAPNETVADADIRLKNILKHLITILPKFIPN